MQFIKPVEELVLLFAEIRFFRYNCNMGKFPLLEFNFMKDSLKFTPHGGYLWKESNLITE